MLKNLFNNKSKAKAKKYSNIFLCIVTIEMLVFKNFVTNNIYAKNTNSIQPTLKENTNLEFKCATFEKEKSKNYVDTVKSFNLEDCYVIQKYDFKGKDDCFIPFQFSSIDLTKKENKNLVIETKDCTTKGNIEKQKQLEEEARKKQWDGSYYYEYMGIPIFISNGSCYQYVEPLKQEMSKIPPHLLNKLANKGWKITITTDNLAETVFMYFYMSVYAYTDFDLRALYIEDRMPAIRNATIHELGHALDKELGWPSYSNDFINRFNMDYNGLDYLTPDYKEWQQDKIEVFAEAFYLCYSNPQKFQQYCPNMYEYIVNIQ